MKISGRVDASVSVSLTRRAAAAAVAATVTTTSTTLSTRRQFFTSGDGSHKTKRSPGKPGRSFFCAHTSQWLYSTFIPPMGSKSSTAFTPRTRDEDSSRLYSTEAAVDTSKPQIPIPPSQMYITDKDVLLSYVRPEDEGPVEEYLNFHRDPYRRGYASSDGPNLQISDTKHDVEYPQREDTFIQEGLKDLVAKICVGISVRQRYPHRVSLESIYKLYCRLPEPRMLNLTGHWRNRLMRIMGTPSKRNSESMLRYFALVADIKNSGLTLRRSQWNYALGFAARYTARIGPQEMESALLLWKQMERDAHVRGNNVTFNILFDVASKAGNFTLAEMIYKEMDNRGIDYNRFHHVSLIHYFGLKLDSSGIRAAYKEMVESGEMIDTVTLNCVIAGFLRCGEEAAAEDTYQKMKNGGNLVPDLPVRDYMVNKMITKVLMMFSRVGKHHPSLKQNLQTHVHLAPDLRTFTLLVEHYSIKVGDLAKVAQYLDEMKLLNIPIHPTIFIALLKGFYVHGGFEGAEWSRQRLEGVLKALYDARDEHAKNFRIDRWAVIWALRAVKRCSSTEAVLQTYEEMQARWDIPENKTSFMHALLDFVIEGRDLRTTALHNVETLHRGHNSKAARRTDNSGNVFGEGIY